MTQERGLRVRVRAQEASRRELQQALMLWADMVRLEEGVRHAHVYEDIVASGVFAVEAAWASIGDLEAHLGSPACTALLGALTVLGHEVDVSVCQRAPEFGTDALEEIRRRRNRPPATPGR
jgi:quinol monooxygenase YgiN